MNNHENTLDDVSIPGSHSAGRDITVMKYKEGDAATNVYRSTFRVQRASNLFNCNVQLSPFFFFFTVGKLRTVICQRFKNVCVSK